jgi:Skp family chaperone for outer membrane proteins
MLRLHMNRFAIIATTLATVLLGTAGAAPRVALVRVKEIYTDLPATTALAQEMKTEREQIGKDQRAADLRRIIEELQALQARLADKKNPLDEETGRKLARSYELKLQEAKTFQQEFENFRSEREKQISRKEVAGMRASLDMIMDVARRIAKERGYEIVLENSGNTNTGLPFILYKKNVPDLTDDVKAAIKDANPAPAKPVVEPKPVKIP